MLANGLNIGLRHTLGMEREIVSSCHSISIGCDLKPIGRSSFGFRALTYYPERTADAMAYMTLFPVGATMRANLFVYRDMHDPWLREMRRTPNEALVALMPGLRKLTGNFEVTSLVRIRPVDLYVTRGYRQPGIVLVGDAFATSCPAAGTGANKVFTDVARLCKVHIPRWLATAGMGEEKISAFYDDAVKVARMRIQRPRLFSCARSRPMAGSPGARVAGSGTSASGRGDDAPDARSAFLRIPWPGGSGGSQRRCDLERFRREPNALSRGFSGNL